MAAPGLVVQLLALVVLCNTAGIDSCTLGQQYCDPKTGDQYLCGPTPISLGTCPTGTSCDTTTLTCQSSSPPSINCVGSGSFPDPYDCHSYFTCTEGTAGSTTSCPSTDPNEYGYDPLTTRCRYSAQDRVCRERPFPACRSVSQAGAQQENPNIYYFCARDAVTQALVPWVASCNLPYQVFDANLLTCVDGTVSTTTTASTSTTTTLSTSTTTGPSTATPSTTSPITSSPTTFSSSTTSPKTSSPTTFSSSTTSPKTSSPTTFSSSTTSPITSSPTTFSSSTTSAKTSSPTTFSSSTTSPRTSSPTTFSSSTTSPKTSSPTTFSSSTTSPKTSSPTTFSSSTTSPITSSPTTFSSSTTSPSTDTTPTTMATSPPMLPSQATPFSCPRVGSFPNPSNCHGYYICLPFLPPVPFTCLYGYFYDPLINFCVKGSCQ